MGGTRTEDTRGGGTVEEQARTEASTLRTMLLEGSTRGGVTGGSASAEGSCRAPYRTRRTLTALRY